MGIIDRNRNPTTPDNYSIKSIRIDYDMNPLTTESLLGSVYLLVDLEPRPYMRKRGAHPEDGIPLRKHVDALPLTSRSGVGWGMNGTREPSGRWVRRFGSGALP
jgi:hypothetical protein